MDCARWSWSGRQEWNMVERAENLSGNKDLPSNLIYASFPVTQCISLTDNTFSVEKKKMNQSKRQMGCRQGNALASTHWDTSFLSSLSSVSDVTHYLLQRNKHKRENVKMLFEMAASEGCIDSGLDSVAMTESALKRVCFSTVNIF